MSRVVDLKLLGPVVVRSEAGDELSVGGAKQRAVLAALALSWPRSRTSDQLIDALWQEDPPASAKNAVQVYVTGLRKILRPHGVDLLRLGAGYALTGPALRIDASTFVLLVSEGRAALRTGDHERAVDRLSRALDLWVGVPLDGLEEVADFRQARESLELERVSALVDLAESLVRSSRPDEAVAVAQRLLTDHPLDERGWMALAAGHYRAGRQSQALEACRRARELLADELGADPSPALAALELQIIRHEVPGSSPVPEATIRALPSLPQPFVGRRDVVDRVTGLLARGQRLVTLVGMGGIGKTTVAVAVARLVDDPDVQVGFVELETLFEPAGVLTRLCNVIGVDAADDPARSLSDHASGWLLVLDNVEQIEGLGPVLSRLLEDCATLRLLVTSRRPLQAPEEYLVRVAPLADTVGGEANPAEELLLARAAAVRPGLDHRATAPAVRQLCTLLGGIPLAIELAGARVRTLTPAQLLARLTDGRSSVLEARTHQEVPLRQASLGAVLSATTELLGGPAAQLLACLGSFDGWVTLELLEVATKGLLTGDFVDALDELADFGLLRLDSEGRCGLLGPVKEHASTLGDRVALDGRMLHAVVSLVRELGPRLVGRAITESVARLRSDADALDTALDQAMATRRAPEAAELVLGLHRYWLLSGQIRHGGSTLTALLAGDLAFEPVTRVRLEILAGTFASYVNDVRAAELLRRALDQAQEMGVPADRILVNGWCCLAAHEAHHGELASAQRSSEQARAAAAISGDRTLVALARDLDGHVATYAGDLQRGLAAKLGGIADARHSGDEYDLVNLLVGAADDLILLGRAEEALVYAEEAFDRTVTSDLGTMAGYVVLMRGLALVACGQSAAAWGTVSEALRLTFDLHTDPLATADALYALGACAADLGRDPEAARLFGAAEVTYADQAVDPGARHLGLIPQHRARLVERLGQSSFEVYASLGASDPSRTVSQIVQAGPVG